MIKDEIDHEQ